MPFVGFVVNRVHPDAAATARTSPRVRAPSLDRRFTEGLIAVFTDERDVARRERRTVRRLAAETGERMVVVPEQDADVHDLRGLREVGEALFAAREKA